MNKKLEREIRDYLNGIAEIDKDCDLSRDCKGGDDDGNDKQASNE